MARSLAVLAEIFHDVPQSLQANAGIVTQLGHDSFKSFQIRHSSIVLSSYVIQFNTDITVKQPI